MGALRAAGIVLGRIILAPGWIGITDPRIRKIGVEPVNTLVKQAFPPICPYVALTDTWLD